MGVSLLHFTEDELKLSPPQASAVLAWFFPSYRILPESLTVKDRSFAQALLVEAIDASYEMSFVEAAWRTFTEGAAKGTEIAALVKSFAKQAVKIWFKHARAHDLMDAKIYESVRSTLTWRWRSEMQIRIETGEYVGY